MPLIHTRGNPMSRIWVIFERPFSTDEAKGFICSGGMGFAFQKMLEEGGLKMSDVFCCCRFPDTDVPMGFVAPDLETYKPPLIFVVGAAGSWYLPELRAVGKQTSHKTQLNKWVGSLLRSDMLAWDHWMMPLLDPQDLMADWTERNVTTYIDIAKLRDELEFWKKHGVVQPLRQRTLLSHDMEDDEVLSHLDSFRSSPFLAEDIETVYPKGKGSKYKGVHPGMPITFGIANSPEFGVSFNLFRTTPSATREVWRAFDRLHSEGATIIGQNFFNFDSLFYNMLGISLRRDLAAASAVIRWPTSGPLKRR